MPCSHTPVQKKKIPTETGGLAGDMAAIEELSPSAGPASTRPPEDEIDDDEDEDVSGLSLLGFLNNAHENEHATVSFVAWQLPG